MVYNVTIKGTKKKAKKYVKALLKAPKASHVYDTNVHHYKYRVVEQVVNNASGQGVAKTFTFSSLPAQSLADLVSLYGLYRIDKIRVEWFPYTNSTEAVVTQVITNAMFYMAFDPANSTAPANATIMIQYPHLKMKQVQKRFSFYIRPMVLDALASVANTSTPIKPPFIPTGNTTVPHLCLRYWLDNSAQGVSGLGQFVYTYFITMKDTS